MLTASQPLGRFGQYRLTSSPAVAPAQSWLRGVGLGDKKRAKAGVGPWLEAEGYSAKLCPRLDV
jgi:hypothetical protein